MTDDPHLGGLLGIQAFHAGQVVRDLRGALAETHHTIIQESAGVAIRGVGVAETWGEERSSTMNAASKYVPYTNNHKQEST